MATIRFRVSVVALMLLVYFAAAATVPTSDLSLRLTDLVSHVSVSASNAESASTSRSLVKRHDYYVACGIDPQDNNPKTGLEGAEDIKLARTCISPPYRYSCDQRESTGSSSKKFSK